MGYRDEEEARKARRAAHEKELADARAELASIEERGARDQERGQALKERIADLEKGDSEREPEPVRETAAEPTPKAKRSIGDVLSTIAWWILGIAIGGGMLASCVSCWVEESTGCRAFQTRVDLRWGAVVTDSRGINLPAGTSCEVRADVWTNASARRVREARTVVSCAGRTLFESETESTSVQLEQSGTPGAYRYGLRCNERAEDLVFQSSGEGASLSRDGRGAYRVDLDLDDTSDVWQDDPAFEPPPAPPDPGFDSIVVRTGRVQSVDGESPVHVDDACTLRVRPIRTREDNCRVRLECANRSLFDAHATCHAAGRAPMHATEMPENRPGLRMDLRIGIVRVSERGPGIPYEATVRLDP